MKSKHEVENSRVYLMDCMEFMKDLPDGYFHLACVDPPYGNIAVFENCQPKERKNKRPKKYKTKDWDNTKPNKEYWDELFRVSKNQIVWGGNYFTDYLPESRGWIYWDKKTGDNNFSDGELAWTSFHKRLMSYSINSKADTRGGKDRIHPTEKPIKLYQWIFKNYLPDGGKVFDSHLGSGSSRIAADKAGNIDFTGTEIDEDYFKASVDRFNKYKSQLTLF